MSECVGPRACWNWNQMLLALWLLRSVGRLLSLRCSFSNPLLDDLSPGGIFSNDLSAITLSGFGGGKEGLIRICSSISAVQMGSDDAMMASSSDSICGQTRAPKLDDLMLTYFFWWVTPSHKPNGRTYDTAYNYFHIVSC